MLVVEDDPQRGGFSPLSDTDLDGVGTDIWGNEWPLGGPIDLKVAEPFTWRRIAPHRSAISRRCPLVRP
jgi:hypothetical protein